MISQALNYSDGVVARAAQRLHIRRTTLVEKMRKYQLMKKQNIGECKILNDNSHEATMESEPLIKTIKLRSVQSHLPVMVPFTRPSCISRVTVIAVDHLIHFEKNAFPFR